MMEGVELEFDPFAINAIVEKAMIRKTGARAFRSIVEEFMLDIMYELPNRKMLKNVLLQKMLLKPGGNQYTLKLTGNQHNINIEQIEMFNLGDQIDRL